MGISEKRAGGSRSRASHRLWRRLASVQRSVPARWGGRGAAVAASGLATAIAGVRFARSAPAGAVPLEDGNTPAAETSAHAARLKHRLNTLSTASAAAQLALVAVNAALAQANFRRPPARRLLRSRY